MHTHETHVLLYTIIFITSLLVLLMMLWHVSTAHLIDKYGMPQEWYDEFIKAQFPGWRIGLWMLLFFMIPLNCIHALLCLDFYAGRVYLRGRSPRTSTEASARLDVPQIDGINDPGTVTVATGHRTRSSSAQQRHSSLPSHSSVSQQQHNNFTPHPSATHARPSKLPSTSHPFLSPGLPSSLRFLPTLYDVVMILLLLFHILIFLTTLHSNMEYCNWTSKAGIALPWDWIFDERGTARAKDTSAVTQRDMSLYDRCVRINVDNWISGGFDIALCLLLLGLHILLLLMRAWEMFHGGSGKEEMSGAKSNEDGVEMDDLGIQVPDGDGDVQATVQSMDGMVEDYVSREQAGAGITAGMIVPVADTNASPAVPHYSGRERRKMASSRVSEGKGPKWTLLECLVGDG